MDRQGFFVTGTDTGCGKTEVTLALMRRLKNAGYTVAGMKPVAAGAALTPVGWGNDDALRLLNESSDRHPYARVNPVLFDRPVAPHLAAEQENRPIELDPIAEAFRVLSDSSDWVMVEGVGGWRVPLGPNLELPDLAGVLGLPVILVVGLRLGCLNHALLTQESIVARGMWLAGWVANTVDPAMALVEANIAALGARLAAPCLGVLPFSPEPDPARLADLLQLPGLAIGADSI